MSWQLYLSLSILMFLEYAIWGAWAPVLAARLVGPLKLSGKQAGWVYATLPLACIVSPLVAGQLADRWLNCEWIIGVGQLAGGILLFVAAGQTRFKPLFLSMLFFALCYAATLPLVNSLMFHQLAANDLDVGTYAPGIFIWAPVAWALAGYFLSGWRWIFKTGEQGRDCLYLAGALSIIMAATCLFMPSTPPAGLGGVPIVKAMGALGNMSFLVFIIISLVTAGLMQFYFLGTAPFMQDMGIPPKNVPGSMAIAQVVQALVTLFLMAWFLDTMGFRWTLVIGASSWFVMYIIYVNEKPRWLIVASQSLHGLAYMSFIIVGQTFANSVAPEDIRGSMQALVFAATTGVGLFLGTHFAGAVMDKFRKEQKFQWRPIFLVPCLIMLGCAVALVLFFRENIQLQ